MSYFDEASLVMIPSGYKTSKVYSVLPTDGSGDLTFSRSNDTATRVNSDGLIEKVRTNLILQSNTFSTTWLFSGTGTVTQGAADPFGGTTAWTFAKTAANAFLYQGTAGITGSVTFSVYAKAGTVDQLWLNHDQSGSFSSYFDLTLGTAISAAGCVATIVSVGGGWYRCSIAGTSATPNNLRIYPASGGSIAGTTGNILIYGAQGETGDIATDYIATTSAAVSVGPVANLPRLDYLDSSCPRLLLEPQRTNLVTYSEQFANWNNAGGTTTANTAISPSGYQDADTLTGARFQSSFASNQYTASCFAKKVDGDNKLVLRLDVPTLKFAQFDLATGSVDSVSADYTATITPYGNGWYRCTITTPASTSISNYVIVSASGGASSTYVWGAQLEAGAYATSYIPTLGASVTRGADYASKTGISSLIGQTEGTLFVEVNQFGGQENSPYLLASDGTFDNRIQISSGGSGTENSFTFYINVGGVNTVLYLSPTAYTGVHKLAIAYKLNDVVGYIDGVQVLNDTSSTIPATTTLEIGRSPSNPVNAGINQALLFKTRLSNADLATLTSL